MGYERDEVCMRVIQKCRPPRNRTPEPEEMAECSPFMHEQIALVGPKVMVALGATAIKERNSDAVGITRLRGNLKTLSSQHPGDANVPPRICFAALRQNAGSGKRISKRLFASWVANHDPLEVTSSRRMSSALHSARVFAPAIALRSLGVMLAALPFLPPVLRHFGAHELAETLASPWEYSCHQLPSRTMSLLGELMPLCSRCLGLVVGLGVGLAASAPYRGPRVLRLSLTAGCLFLFLELTTQDLGWHPVFHPTRLLSGLLVAFPAGAAAGALAMRLCREKLERQRSDAFPSMAAAGSS
ncbi:MAG: DUF2085 domain-containing protein [Polyangiaceae bacterium]